MRYLFIAFLVLQSFSGLAWGQSLFEARQRAHEEAITDAIRTGQQNYYNRIHQKITSALSEKFHVEFYASGSDYVGGSYACGLNQYGGDSISCLDSQNNYVGGLSGNELRRALGCEDYYSYFVSGDISRKCGRKSASRR